MTDPDGLDLEGIAASPSDVRLIAAWGEEDVMLSVDEGRTWQKVLEHDGMIEDALFDCHGRLHVLRDHGQLGTFDDGDGGTETWTRAAAFYDGSDSGRLVPDGNGVAVIGPDPAARDQLILARRDMRGRWRSVPLAHDSEYGSWDGISISAIEPLGKDRFRMLAMPWQGGECGYSRYLEIGFDLDARHVVVTQLGEELPEPSRWRPRAIEGVYLRVRDAAGRWINLADDVDASPRLTRAS